MRKTLMFSYAYASAHKVSLLMVEGNNKPCLAPVSPVPTVC